MTYPLYLAPMEDVTDPIFRLLCKRFGADRVYTEFVNADALIRDVPSTARKLTISEQERPLAIQIYGKNVESMVAAAKIVEQAQPDFIDLNFGCPVKKVANKGAGAGLLQNIPLLLDIARNVVKAVKLPVTAKTRLGWDDSSKIIVDLAEALQDCGIRELTIHGRTRSQMYKGDADWTLIGAVKNNPRMHIPIVGNGDITSPQRAKECFEKYGIDAIMIGRATFGNPWIFQDIKHFLNTGSERPPIPFKEKIELLKEYTQNTIQWIGDERRGIIHCRRHYANTPLFKGLNSFKQTRIRLLQAQTKHEVFTILDEITTQYAQT